MLIERARNIRKQMSKLCTFGKSCASATGGGHLPPGDMPKVSFEMSDAVRAYAATINFKLVGLPSQGDSDMPLVGSSNTHNNANAVQLLDEIASEHADTKLPMPLSKITNVNAAVPMPRNYEL